MSTRLQMHQCNGSKELWKDKSDKGLDYVIEEKQDSGLPDYKLQVIML